MNVLFLALDVDLAAERGDAIHVLELARALGSRGHGVDVVAVRAPPDAAVPPKVRVEVRPTARDWQLVRFCADLARHHRADVVYERRLSPKIAFAASRLAALPFVVEVNGIPEEAAMLRSTRASAFRPVKSRLRARLFRSAAGVVAVSERLAARVRQEYGLPPARVVVVPNGVDTDRFRPMDGATARRRLGRPDGREILFVGNLVPWQGVDTLIRAVPEVLRSHPDVRFFIVGDGVAKAPLERLAREVGAAERVRFEGAVRHREVPVHIAAADVCVAPFSRRRNEAVGLSPLKVYEYLACARAVVASDLPGVGDALRGRGVGIAVPPDDPAALTAAIARLLNDPAEAHAMGERGRRFAVEECSWARTAERVEQVLRRAVEEGRGA